MTLKPALLGLALAASAALPLAAQDVSDATRAANDALLDVLPFDDRRDFEAAQRGFIATLEDPVITDADGNVVFDTGLYDFVSGAAPATANPSLWRQSELNAFSGLFEVTEGIYQVRNFDLANVSFIRGDTGWIVIDPLTANETAAAALQLLRDNVEDLPVTAVIFTHSHADHFAGVKGVADAEAVASGEIEVIGPEGFFLEAVNENLMAGNQMSRRAQYMYGNVLDKSPTGTLGSGLGTTTSGGTVTIVEPTTSISARTIAGDTPTTLDVDGVEMAFWYTPHAEAPSELMIWLPEHNALMQSEEINHTLHNLYTLRGAQVRNGLLWSKYIQDVIVRYGDTVEVSFGSHHWPTWGNADIVEFWKGQRDTYRYIHDETLRLANHGMTMLEVAEEITLPDSLARQFANRGYYGSVNHNAKAQYQLYFGWFSGNPAELHELPPVAEAVKFVEYVGGPDAVIEKARADYDAGEYRFAATALNHVVFADPENADAKALLADVYTQMGYQAESGPWRNFYLAGAAELRNGIQDVVAVSTTSADIVRNLGLETYLDFLAVRLNGPQAAEAGTMSINLIMPDAGAEVGLVVENGVLNYTIGQLTEDADTDVTMDRAVLDDINLGLRTLEQGVAEGDVTIGGDADTLGMFVSMLDTFDPQFPIVTP